SGTAFDTFFNTSSGDFSAGVTHTVPDHGGDIDVAVQCDTDLSGFRGRGLSLLLFNSDKTSAVRASGYHGSTHTHGASFYGYTRAGGAGGALPAGLAEFMSGTPSWMRVKYTSSSGLWEFMHSVDGANWVVKQSVVRSMTVTTFKVGYTST